MGFSLFGRKPTAPDTGYAKRLESLKTEFSGDCVTRKNGTLLLCPGKIPKCRHMLFAALSDKLIKEFLADGYKNKFPEEYRQFLRYSNGAELFWTRRTTANGVPFAKSMLSFYGLPRTQPFSRPNDEEEPFDLRVEDLARHAETPAAWLKCGSYYGDPSSKVLIDIFIDTESGKVYACNKNESAVHNTWDSFDECFCSIFDSLAACPPECEF